MIHYINNNSRNIGLLASRMYKFAGSGVPYPEDRLAALRRKFPDYHFLDQEAFNAKHGADPRLAMLNEEDKQLVLQDWYNQYLDDFYEFAEERFLEDSRRTPLELVPTDSSDTPDDITAPPGETRVKLTSWIKDAPNARDFGQLPPGWRILNRPLDSGGTGEDRYTYPVVNADGVVMGKAFNDNTHRVLLNERGRRYFNPKAVGDESGYNDTYYQLPDDGTGKIRGAMRRYGRYYIDKNKFTKWLKSQKSRMEGRSNYVISDKIRAEKEKRLQAIEKDLSGKGIFNLQEKPGSEKYKKLNAERAKLRDELAYNAYNDLIAERGALAHRAEEIQSQLDSWLPRNPFGPSEENLRAELRLINSQLERDPLENVMLDMEQFKRSRRDGVVDETDGALIYKEDDGTYTPIDLGHVSGFDKYVTDTYKNPEKNNFTARTELGKWQDREREVFSKIGPSIATDEYTKDIGEAEDAAATMDLADSMYKKPERLRIPPPDFKYE